MMSGNKINIAFTSVARPFQTIGYYLELFKLHLCLYIGFSAVFGFVAAQGTLSLNALAVGGLIFVLACGSAVLNNIQDKEFDRYFKRTHNRSLPAGKVPVAHALIISCVMIASGLTGLWAAAGFFSFFLGVFTVLCYNALYTPMKKKTLLAILPGALCGMLAPMIGWTAAKGSFTDPAILVIMTVFGLWQVPHFFIIVLKTRDRMVHQINTHRFPSFLKVFSTREIKLQILIWTSLYTLAMLLFLQHGAIGHDALFKTLFLNAVTSWVLIVWVVFKKKSPITTAFAGINLSMLVFMGAGICDKLF
ncbi:MAG: UbiA family prenyltransferase [Desulfobacula sp.]|nr:UbiA family prenyltransferase [Desulfobacula sp.]